jgi:hypothetical protein
MPSNAATIVVQHLSERRPTLQRSNGHGSKPECLHDAPQHFFVTDAALAVRGSVSCEPFHFIVADQEQPSIRRQEAVQSQDSAPLVAVQEWMVGDQGVKKGCSLLFERWIYLDTTRSLERSPYCRLQQGTVSKVTVDGAIRPHSAH